MNKNNGDIWKIANKEIKEAIQRKRLWITYFMNIIIRQEISLANRRMANRYKEEFVKKVKINNPELYFKIWNQLKPLWEELQNKRLEDIKLAKNRFKHEKYQGMITDVAKGKQPMTFHNREYAKIIHQHI